MATTDVPEPSEEESGTQIENDPGHEKEETMQYFSTTAMVSQHRAALVAEADTRRERRVARMVRRHESRR